MILARLDIDYVGFWRVEAILELTGENLWTIRAYRFGKYDAF